MHACKLQCHFEFTHFFPTNVFEGVLDMGLQNMPLWHIDYYELKALEKEQIQEELSDLSFCTQTQVIKFLMRKVTSCTRKRTFFSLETGSQCWRVSVQTNLLNSTLFLLLTPSYFLVSVLQFTAPVAQATLVTIYCLFTELLDLLASLGLQFSYEGSHAHKIIKCILYAFLLRTCLMLV